MPAQSPYRRSYIVVDALGNRCVCMYLPCGHTIILTPLEASSMASSLYDGSVIARGEDPRSGEALEDWSRDLLPEPTQP
jgi:hypothetical protein